MKAQYSTALLLAMLLAGCTSERAADQDAATGERGPDRSVPAAGNASAEMPTTADLDGSVAASSKREALAASDTRGDDAIAADDGRWESTESTDSEAGVTPSRQRQSGVLTAGSFDDVKNFDVFNKFLSNALQHDAHGQLPRFAVGKQLVIQVVNDEMRPIGGADITVYGPDDEQQSTSPLARLTTGSDGRALLLTGTDTAGEDTVTLVVDPGDQSGIVRTTAHAGQGICTVRLPDTQAALPKSLDLALVIDATGSMGDELEYLKTEIDSIAQSVSKLFPNVDQRYALIVYRDNGDEYVTKTFDFTSSLADFRSTLAAQRADGGGDYPEAMHLAMQQASQLDWRAGNSARVMFLVADAPPHDDQAERTLQSARDLRELGVRVYPLGGSGVQLKAELVMRASALLSMGQYLFLTDHSGVGNPHAKPHVPEYSVERLDRLMIRMVAQELAGKRLAPKEVLAIERGEWTPSAGPIEPVPQQQSCFPPPTDEPAAASLASLRWLVLAGFALGAFGIDAWDKRKRNARQC